MSRKPCAFHHLRMSVGKESWNIPATVEDVEDLHARFRDAIQDHILAHWEAPVAFPQIVATATGVWVVSQKGESARQEVDEFVRRSLIVFGNVFPDVEKISPRPPRQTVGCHRERRPNSRWRRWRASRFNSSARSGSVARV